MAGFHKAGPNEALIVSGGGKQPAIIVGGRKFVLPILQKAQTLSLEIMTLTVNTATVYTSEGVAVSVDGVAQVKVGRGEEAIRTAAQQFLGKRPNEIADIALQTLEGQQRAILGTMTVEEIYQDRVAFATRVREVAASDMTNMGLEIVSFVVRDIQDTQGYLEALGVRRTAEVKRDAAIGEAEAKRDAGIKEAQADRKTQAARFEADTGIAESERDFSTEKAAYDKQVNARKAEAELAYALQEAKTRQQIRQEELQIDVVERQKQVEVEEKEIERRERELDATIRRPAEAERYRLETVAEGEKARVLAEAQAEAEAIRLRGQADADAIKARGLAEAEAMTRKADAWKEYGQAAMIQQLLESLPAVATAVAMPLSKTDRITVISGGDGDGAGASKVTRDVTNVIAQLPALVESLTGVDLLGTLKSLPGIVTTEEASSQKPASGDGTTPVEPEVATPEDETAGQADS
jgi:flotillin